MADPLAGPKSVDGRLLHELFWEQVCDSLGRMQMWGLRIAAYASPAGS